MARSLEVTSRWDDCAYNAQPNGVISSVQATGFFIEIHLTLIVPSVIPELGAILALLRQTDCALFRSQGFESFPLNTHYGRPALGFESTNTSPKKLFNLNDYALNYSF
jgi:hypothetical protein